MSDCCLTAYVSYLSAVSWREQFIFQSDNDDIRFELDQQAKLNLYNVHSRRIDM